MADGTYKDVQSQPNKQDLPETWTREPRTLSDWIMNTQGNPISLETPNYNQEPPPEAIQLHTPVQAPQQQTGLPLTNALGPVPQANPGQAAPAAPPPGRAPSGTLGQALQPTQVADNGPTLDPQAVQGFLKGFHGVRKV